MNTLPLRLFLVLLLIKLSSSVFSQETIIKYLSGTGKDNTVNWQFFCTDGRNSGKWTTIPVPSNWELQGFGKYNYGHDKDTVRGYEKGLYKFKFIVPAILSQKIVNIVFDGSMTDTEVKINGNLAGPVHQGSFYRFSYDITKLIHFGKSNLLEVIVSKHSANTSVNKAERKGDFWIFGGIFRPVYLEAFPKTHIKQVGINAKADGALQARLILSNIDSNSDVYVQILNMEGQKVGSPAKVAISKGDTVAFINHSINSPSQWTPETPALYNAVFTIVSNGNKIHSITRRFGFRTVELRDHDGVYVNGIRIKFKGVNRHSTWPSSGKTTSKSLSISDVQLMKDMNMNAVRMSHYPPDEHFLDVCDSLGLFVLDELTGWHNMYDTPTGTKLVKEMVSRDVNHPSVIIWCNGNEGGHNLDFDSVFDNEDIQKRPVVHPWQNFRGIDAQHYRDYNYGNGSYFEGHDVFFPTEFLHGLYDGGLGSGLYDYWEAMWNNPLSAGGFLWVFSDEGVVRNDKNGIVDTDGSHAPDGILGPYREKEASFYTIKEVWSPIKFEHREITPKFNGEFTIENRYFYTNTKQCLFSWSLIKAASPWSISTIGNLSGQISAPDIMPGSKGVLEVSLPGSWLSYDFLYITATDGSGKEIYTWSWPISKPQKISNEIVITNGKIKPTIKEQDSLLIIHVNDIEFLFNRNSGLLKQVKNPTGIIPFSNGPILCEGENDFKEYTFTYKGDTLILSGAFGKKSNYKILQWVIYPSGWIKLDVQYCPIGEESSLMGVSFSYPENLVTSATLLGDGPYRVWKNRTQGVKLGLWDKKYNNTITGYSDTLIYPEFKGFYSNFYWVKIFTKEQPFTIVTSCEDIFLHLFTPQFPKERFNIAPAFPSGNISFLHGITAIGTKGQKPENLGPSGKKNMYFDYWKARPKSLTFYFDFSGK
jgi:hypothetical protein